MRQVKNVREAVKLLGGGASVARAVGVSRTAVFQWTHRERFPGERYHPILALGAEHNLHIPDALFTNVYVHPRDVKERHDSALPEVPRA